jgi:septum formation topological specificity factor MinE
MDRIRSVGGRSPEETAEAHKKALEVLAGAERDALEAGQIIEKLKKEIYRELGIKP